MSISERGQRTSRTKSQVLSWPNSKSLLWDHERLCNSWICGVEICGRKKRRWQSRTVHRPTRPPSCRISMNVLFLPPVSLSLVCVLLWGQRAAGILQLKNSLEAWSPVTTRCCWASTPIFNDSSEYHAPRLLHSLTWTRTRVVLSYTPAHSHRSLKNIHVLRYV